MLLRFELTTPWIIHLEKMYCNNFSMVLDRRIAYLRENSCPVLGECSFTFKKQAINEADSVIIAAKRYFPYGGKESGKTWLLIIPGEVKLSYH